MNGFVIEGEKLPEWLRSFFVDDTGQVFLPCGAMGDELEATLCLAHDGVSFVREDGHVYAPAWWLVRQYPRFADTINTLVANVARLMRSGERCAVT